MPRCRSPPGPTQSPAPTVVLARPARTPAAINSGDGNDWKPRPRRRWRSSVDRGQHDERSHGHRDSTRDEPAHKWAPASRTRQRDESLEAHAAENGQAQRRKKQDASRETESRKDGVVQTVERQIDADDRQRDARDHTEEDGDPATSAVEEREWNHRRQDPADVRHGFGQLAMRRVRRDAEERKEEAQKVPRVPAAFNRVLVRDSREARRLRNEARRREQLKRADPKRQQTHDNELPERASPRPRIAV